MDLKAFTERFYREVCGGQLGAVLDSLKFIRHETDAWLEWTMLLIPGESDSDAELEQMTSWVVENLGPDVPMHFSAFHPDWKMRDVPPTPPETLTRARGIAMRNSVKFAFTGNVHDRTGSSTWSPKCGELLIERDWYQLGKWGLNSHGGYRHCGEQIPGCFAAAPGQFGARRIPVRLAAERPTRQ